MLEKHNWVCLIYIPIEVELNADGVTLDTFTAEAAEEVAREHSLLTCWFCDATLTTDNYNEDCPGVEVNATQSK